MRPRYRPPVASPPEPYEVKPASFTVLDSDLESLGIKGHPAIEFSEPLLQHRTPLKQFARRFRKSENVRKITVCSECGSLRSILWLQRSGNRDRWFCNQCRAEGEAKPTQIPLSNPAARRKR